MTNSVLKNRLNIGLLSVGLLVCGCGESTLEPVGNEVPKVALMVGEAVGTKTVYDASENNFIWRTGDKLAVWAKSSSGSFTLADQVFHLLATDAGGTSAYFTSSLSSAMDEGTYSYYVTYPVPESADGSKVTFNVPAVQDGTASGGADILLSVPVTGPELSPVAEGSPVDQGNVVKIRMKHILHFLRFYIPEGCNKLGEPVKRIEFTMPQSFAGTVSVDVTDASSASLGGKQNSMVLNLKTPVDESSDGNDFALAAIFPPDESYGSDDQMTIKVYSENKWSELSPVSLSGRSFAAGHITRVPLKPKDVKPIVYELKFVLASNNLGEDVKNIRITLPDGELWPGEESSTLSFSAADGGFVKTGDTFTFSTQDKDFFKNLSSKQLTVEYESESAIVNENLALGNLSDVMSKTCSLNCPYLFYEDFSAVDDLSSNDEYSMSSLGSKSAVSFLNGWTAARVGAQAGTSIRLACRRETSADYPARADSPFLSGLKDGVTVNLELVFDYSMNRQGYATWPFSVPEISQTVHLGSITTSDALKSGDGTGNFQVEFTVNETSGSYTNVNHTYSTELTSLTAPFRLSWRTTPEHKAGTSNNTCWLYIDNIKVKIKK